MKDAKAPGYLIFDGHNDSLLSQYMNFPPQRSLLTESDRGHLDFPRAEKVLLMGGLFAIFIPHPEYGMIFDPSFQKKGALSLPSFLLDPIDPDYARKMSLKAIEALYRIVEQSNGKVAVARCAEEIAALTKEKIFSVLIHFEGAEAIHPDLDGLGEFYEKGLRSIGLVWSRENAYGHGVKFAFPGTPDQGPGLTDSGKALVKACNEMGVMVDLSHLNEKGFWDVHAITDKPLVVTHACVHAISPSSRNLTDRQLDAIGESDGVVGINFSVEFIRPDGTFNTDTPLKMIVAHFRYIADRIGVDHVAFGSDFDGATISRHLKDVTGLNVLIRALEKDGFNEEEVRKIVWGNWMRVLKKTLKKGVEQ